MTDTIINGGVEVVPTVKDKDKFVPPREGTKKSFQLKQLLTGREQEVLSLLATGLTNNQIAATLHISKHTVKNHVSSIYRKLEISDRTKVALLAIRNGFVALE